MSYVPTIELGVANCSQTGARPAGGRDLIVFLSEGATPSAAEFPASSADVFDLDNLRVTFDRTQRILWWAMRPRRRPSFTSELLADMKLVIDALEALFAGRNEDEGEDEPGVAHLVLSSLMPGIFNLGGDLSLFLDLIERRDRAALTRYAHHCAEGQHRIASNFDLPISTVALVQGDALGGGFEAALANDVIIAERSAKFGLPEVLFNLFPGMGAYSFLARRIGAVEAERMILSGRIYSADELAATGVVDAVVDDGAGAAAVYDHVAAFQRIGPARQAVLQARRIVNPVTREELIRIADVWVETALMLSSRDLRRMRHLAIAQDRRWATLQSR